MSEQADTAATIHEFLDRPFTFDWGGKSGEDCCTFCARWVEMLTGTDPAAPLRGTYSDQSDAHSILNAAGGHIEFMASHLEPMGFVRVLDLRDGDIGVVKVPKRSSGSGLISALRFGPLWAMLGPEGVRAMSAEALVAWRLSKVND